MLIVSILLLSIQFQLAVKEAESARIAARHVRKSAMDAIKTRKADLPLDEFKRLEKEVQAMTDASVDSIDKAVAAKVKSIDI
jgi:ribosome recycling factor